MVNNVNMERLNKIMTSKPSVHLFSVQIHLLIEFINQNGGKSARIHKFLYRFDYKGESFYLKVNSADSLFFLFTKTSSGIPKVFQSMRELRIWFEEMNTVG